MSRDTILDGQTTIAIIGVGAKMPGALSAPTFWENIKNSVYAISDVPIDRWDPTIYWDPDPNAPDKTYSKIGGWVTDFAFDRKAFRMPPSVVEKVDPTQLLCLEAVREALTDAGYIDREFDRDRTAVILGNALGGDLRDTTNLRIQYAELDVAMRAALLNLSTGRLSDDEVEQVLTAVSSQVKDNIIGINEDSMPGELANIIAGRVAQTFDLRGPNYVCDAACASTLAALESAIYGLRAGQFDMVVTGGADRSMGPPSYVKFSKIGALSPDGSRPFDAGANGFVMGEGAGILILKRLADAIEDGDQIYALIRGIGGSSDGRGKGITAPNPRGQKHAMRRAYQDAGIAPRTVTLVEAHGTSTPVGDPAEIESLREVYDEDDTPVSVGAIGLGSVKSMIGHLKSAAAAASLVKVAYALRDRQLPPTINVETPNPLLQLDGTPFRLQLETQPWDLPANAPRRAAISAFGFGGTNFHAVLEEYDPEGSVGRSRNWSGNAFSASKGSDIAMAQSDLSSGILGFAADSIDTLSAQFNDFAARLHRDGLIATAPHRLPVEGGESKRAGGNIRLAIAYGNEDELVTRVGRTQTGFERGKGWRLLENQGIYLTEEPLDPKIAMLFPGQGTQYLGMLADLRGRFPAVDRTIAEADAIMTPLLGEPLSDIIYPANEADEISAFSRLTQTEITQPAVLTADIAIMRLLGNLGIRPSMVAGHSLGEYGACVAAGVMTFEEALRTVARRGTAMAEATPLNGDNGLMAGVPMSAEDVQAVLDEVDGYVVCANKNCSKQTIIAGLTEPVQEAIAKFEAMGKTVVVLPVSHAFHSKVVAAASEPLRRHLDTIDIRPPQTPILTNVTGDFYPEGAGVEDEIRDLLSKQVAAPVEFIALVEQMYAAGARVFVEVGPKRAQTSFVADILQGRPHAAMFTNHPKKGDIGSLFEALAQLWSVGAWTPGDEPNLDPKRPDDSAATTSSSNGGAGFSAVSHDDALAMMIEVLCEKTGYNRDEIEPDFELEADLGVDTVKQAEIMATVRDHYGFAKDDDFRLAEYPTLHDLARYICERLALEPGAKASPTVTIDAPAPAPMEARAPAATTSHADALAMMIEVLCEKTGYDPDEIEPDFELEADLGVDTVKQAEIMATVRDHYGFAKDDDFRLSEYPTLNDLARYICERMALEPNATAPAPAKAEPMPVAPTAPVATTTTTTHADALSMMVEVLCEKTGYDPDEIEADFELEADLGVDTVKQAEIMATVREHYGFAKDDDFRLAAYPTLNDLARYICERIALEPNAAPADAAPPAPKQPAREPRDEQRPTPTRGWENPHAVAADVVISGCALGLPGTDSFLSDDSVDTLLEGRNLIGEISTVAREAMVQKNVTRLIKGRNGGGEMVPVDKTDDVLKLAGQMGAFDLAEFDVPERLVEAMDRTSQLAFAAGLLALRDAGLPLIPRFRTTTNGKQITVGWTLPEALADDTGVIFATAFAGQDALVEEVTRSHTDPDYQFDHRFLLKVLGIANSRFAEYIGARGPNTKINNACASTTTAMALAQDWIRAGRCKRVVILGADNVSGDELLEWVGAGFLATGAATTEADVADAALPFDRRRNGIIMGMGALAMVLEAAGLPEARGIEPIADLLETRIANSAEHPTRLVPQHIADEVGKLIDQVEASYGVKRAEIASKTVFVSHETYSPARGGSAQTEIESLRQTFGEDASQVVIANTKGFTGHAMGAGIEDVLALKALQRRQLPHIANFKEPDPELGDLRLSQGGDYELDYALRLAAGFGSQLALAVLRFRARTEDRIAAPERYDAWLREVSGFEDLDLVVENRNLRLREGEPKTKAPVDMPRKAAPATAAATSPARPSAGVRTNIEPRPSADAERFEQLGVVVEAHAAPVYDLGKLRTRLDGQRVAVVAGPLVVTELVVHALERCGATVLVVEGEESRNPLDVDFALCDLTDEDALIRELRTFGEVVGVVNLLGFGTEKFAPADVYRAARHSFHVARAWRFAMDRTPVRGDFFLTVTGMGGRLGFDRATGPLPVCGAVAGFTKALAREWQEATIRVLDVARRGFDPNLGLQLLWEGLFGGGIEIGLIGGVRYLPSTVRADEITPDALPSVAPTRDDVLVVTGGAKGITAEVALNLAERYGCRLALVGRTVLTHEDPLAVDIDAAKAHAKAEITARGERATPKAVRDALAPLESQRLIATNVNRMRAAGSDVAYFGCDVADQASVEQMIAAVVERFGGVDGVIHGAGVEESRLIEDKDVRGFDRVFRGKALGAIHLWNAVEQHKPSFFMTFSSVAGRFGNPGQVDYSAANEVLNKLVALLNAGSKVRATSIDWTAWDEVGMAADGGMRMLLEARGVDLLPPDIGAPMVGDFLEAGLAGEFVVAGALGDFAADVAGSETGEAFDGAPLVAELIERTDDHVVVARTFSLTQDQFLADHVYEGNPVVPGVMGFEMMVEAARMLIDEPAAVVRDVQFEHAIKLHRDEPVRLIATARRNGRSVDVVVETRRETKTGRIVETVHYRGVVDFAAEPTRSGFALDSTAPMLAGPSRELIYERYFHTGTFQVLDAVPFVADDFVVGTGSLPTRALTRAAENGDFVTDPMVREMAFQVAGLWGMVQNEMSYLPYSIARADQFGAATPGTPLSVRCLRRSDPDEHMIAFDIEVVDEGGHLLQRMEKVQMVGHRKLTEDERFGALKPASVHIRRLDTSASEAVLQRRGITFDELVDAEERVAYDRLISKRRRGEWAAARVAMKTLVADWIRDFTGHAVSPSSVKIRKDEHGAPHLVLDGAHDIAMPAISITHSGGVSVAALAPDRAALAIGVDLETVEQRDDAFARNYFSDDELQLAPDFEPAVLHAALWSVKEAVSKALGIGLQARLEEIEVRELQPNGPHFSAVIALTGQAADAARKAGGAQPIVELGLEASTVFTIVTMTLDPTARAQVAAPGTNGATAPATNGATAPATNGATAPATNGATAPATNGATAPATHGAAKPSERADIELAAIAALLVHRGLIQPEVGLDGELSESEDLSAWKR